MIKEALFERRFRRRFKKLIDLKTFGNSGDWKPLKITKRWQLEVLENLSDNLSKIVFKKFDIEWPEDSDMWTDLSILLSSFTRNKVVTLDGNKPVKNPTISFDWDGIEICAHDMEYNAIRIRLSKIDRFKTRTIDDDEDVQTYKLSKIEQERKWMFYDAHKKCHGTMETIFIPTTIGETVKVRCTGCGEKIDITDTSCW